MNSPLSIIVSREYLERVKRKSFIITTILMPLFMLGLMVVPALIAMVSTPDKQRIAVIDNSGLLAARLQNSSEVSFTVVDSDLDAAKADEQYYGVLEIGRDVVDNPSDVRLYTHGPASMMVEQFISGQLESGIESIRLGRYNIDNLEQILNSVHAKVALSTMRIDKVSAEEALELMSRNDKRRKYCHNQICQAKWGDSRTYDICVNSAKLDIRGTCDLLEAYVRARIAAL